MIVRLIFCAAIPLIMCTASAQQAAEPLGADCSVEQILDALHARGIGLKDLSADVSLTETDALTGDATTLVGRAWYKPVEDGQGRLRVVFDLKKVGDRQDRQFKQEYLLDKGWLIERDYRRRIQIDRQVLKPGQKMNLLKLGEGPFPLPIGQPREDVLKMFEVSRVAPADGDPPQTVRIRLKPRPQTRFARRFKTIDVWVGMADHFPRRIETVDLRETETKTTDLDNIRVNSGLDDKHFELEKVEGWTVKSEPLDDI